MGQTKVAIQLISTGGMYGAERVLLELAAYLKCQGWECYVVALEGDGAAPLVARSKELGLCGQAFTTGGRLGVLPMIAKLRRLLDRHPAAIIHSHGYKPDILLASLGLPRKHPCLATCHNWISDTWKLRLIEIADRRALRRLHHVVAVSNEVLQKLVSSGVPRERALLIGNGIDAPRVAEGARDIVRREFGLNHETSLVVQIGRLAYSKRSDLLLRAVRRLVPALDLHVLFIGEGSQRDSILLLAAQLGIAERVHVCGYRQDIGNLLAAADVLAVTSDVEAMPIVVLEAMAVRCPIVATRVGEIPSLLADGQNGVIIPPGEVESIADAIRLTLAEPELSKIRAMRAYETFQKRYSREAMGARYLELYDRCWYLHDSGERRRPSTE